jgi:hypothetical protein
VHSSSDWQACHAALILLLLLPTSLRMIQYVGRSASLNTGMLRKPLPSGGATRPAHSSGTQTQATKHLLKYTSEYARRVVAAVLLIPNIKCCVVAATWTEDAA